MRSGYKQGFQLAGMRGFSIVWAGQLVSLLGTGMTRFALTIWAWQMTGEATALALVGFFSFAPVVVASPFAGALVDRWSRKRIMIVSDLGAGLATVMILALYMTNQLQIWHLYIAGAVAGTFESFQFPAFSAAIAAMLPSSQYTRQRHDVPCRIFCKLGSAAVSGDTAGVDWNPWNLVDRCGQLYICRLCSILCFYPTAAKEPRRRGRGRHIVARVNLRFSLYLAPPQLSLASGHVSCR